MLDRIGSPERTQSVAKKWVLVSGGTRGIGKEVVTRLSDSGYDVVFTYNKSEEAARAMEQAARNSGRHVIGYRCDAGSAEAVEAFADMVLARYGAPYAVVNNVGITRDALLMHMPVEHWHDVINANVNSAFFIIRKFLAPMMERADGCIIQMSSVTALRGNRGQTNYGATKAALIGFTRSLAVEVARFNIRVNVVAPGLIATEMSADIPKNRLKAMVNNIPLRRLGKVEEVAAMVDFLLSAPASYVTGQTFVIDGGISA